MLTQVPSTFNEAVLYDFLLQRPLVLMIPGLKDFIEMGVNFTKYKELYWPLDNEEHNETHQFQKDLFLMVYDFVKREKYQKTLNVEIPCHPLTTNVKEDLKRHFESLLN